MAELKGAFSMTIETPGSFDDLNALPVMTQHYPIRIHFRDDIRAHSLAQKFEPYSYDYVEGYSMKRAGATHVLLLSVASESDFALFASACRSHPDVVDIHTITEKEFWDAPSNSM